MADKYPNSTFNIISWNTNHQVYELLKQKNIKLHNFKSYRKLMSLFNLFVYSLQNRNKYDVIIDFEQYAYITSFFMCLMAPKNSVAFRVNGYVKHQFSTLSAAYSLNIHETVNFYNLAVSVFSKIDLHMPVRKSSLKRCIGIHPSSKWKQKVWNKDKFIELIKKISETNSTYTFKVFLGPDDNVDSWDNIDVSGIEIVKNKTITEIVPILKDLELLISNDNGIMHLAAYLGIKVVGIFGMSDPIQWHAINNRENVVETRMDCAPCNKLGTMKRCHNYECIKRITVEDVFSKVERCLLNVSLND